MLWDPHDIERQTQANMMVWFENVFDHSKELLGGKGINSHHVVIKSQLQFFRGI